MSGIDDDAPTWRGVTDRPDELDLPPKLRHRVSGLVLLFAITYIDRVCISVAGPRMQEDLGIDPVGWGWVTAMFTLAHEHVGAGRRSPGLDRLRLHRGVSGSYDAPFVPMAALLLVGTLLWFRIDAATDVTAARAGAAYRSYRSRLRGAVRPADG